MSVGMMASEVRRLVVTLATAAVRLSEAAAWSRGLRRWPGVMIQRLLMMVIPVSLVSPPLLLLLLHVVVQVDLQYFPIWS